LTKTILKKTTQKNKKTILEKKQKKNEKNKKKHVGKVKVKFSTSSILKSFRKTL
jgi:hypothetical protein